MFLFPGSDSSESDGPPVHYLARERRRRKKKLKSRRERNKRKAILKLSHFTKNSAPSSHAPPSLPPPPPQPTSIINQPHVSDDKKSTVEMVSPLSGLGETSKNNGIPVFVQERLEERNKKKMDAESTTEILLNEVGLLLCSNSHD